MVILDAPPPEPLQRPAIILRKYLKQLDTSDDAPDPKVYTLHSYLRRCCTSLPGVWGEGLQGPRASPSSRFMSCWLISDGKKNHCVSLTHFTEHISLVNYIYLHRQCLIWGWKAHHSFRMFTERKESKFVAPDVHHTPGSAAPAGMFTLPLVFATVVYFFFWRSLTHWSWITRLIKCL